MRVLVIKTSSFGDVIHTLPALSDAAAVFPNIEFDWIVEEPLQMIPSWHKNVRRIIPLNFRYWRKQWKSALMNGEMFQTLKNIRKQRYDKVIDAQGLLKSAFLTLMTRGPKYGFSWTSARESCASLFYGKRAVASWSLHAVLRTRLLFAQSLGYICKQDTPDYGIDENRLVKGQIAEPYCVFLHGTTWESKHWPESFWIELANKVVKAGYRIQLLGNNKQELERSTRIAAVVQNTTVMPQLDFNRMAGMLAEARGVVSVDTGPGHLSAALGRPTVSLYGPTDPALTGTNGPGQIHLKSNFGCSPCLSRHCSYPGDKTIMPPCFTAISPALVWQQLEKNMNLHQTSLRV